MSNYSAKQVQRVLDETESHGTLRVKVWGEHQITAGGTTSGIESKWFNVTREQLESFVATLLEEGDV
jgi:hypothetical protein